MNGNIWTDTCAHGILPAEFETLHTNKKYIQRKPPVHKALNKRNHKQAETSLRPRNDVINTKLHLNHLVRYPPADRQAFPASNARWRDITPFPTFKNQNPLDLPMNEQKQPVREAFPLEVQRLRWYDRCLHVVHLKTQNPNPKHHVSEEVANESCFDLAKHWFPFRTQRF